jgi:hypothetical protein
MNTVVIQETDNNVTISLKRGAKGGYAWEFTIRGNHEADVSARITALNTAYLQLYGKNQATGGSNPE